jgi:uncharacterized protein YndB with AHSA1/START domain
MDTDSTDSHPSDAVAPLVLEHGFAADQARIYRAWTEADELALWFAPQGCSNQGVELDLSEGGSFRHRIKAPGVEGLEIQGQFRTIAAGKELSCSWEVTAPGGVHERTELRIRFESAGASSTRVRIEHQGFSSTRARDLMQSAWRGCFLSLEQFLRGQECPR